MQKVLIIGPKFHYFNNSVERAFCSLGFTTRVLAYDNPVHPYHLTNKIRYKFAADKIALKRQSRARFRLEAELMFAQFNPDLVFVMNGDMLLPDTILHWRGKQKEIQEPVKKSAKVVLWFFDSMSHIPLCEDNITAVDEVFCYEQTDIPLVKQRYGVDAHFLPQAVDPTIYHPDDQSELDTFHLVFAGDLVHSQRRREIVQAVVARYRKSCKIRIWGEYKPWYKNLWQWLTREYRDIYMNRNATGEELCRDYARSRIVLNIHHEQQKDGANPKVYEIAATGAYQICDSNPYIDKLFAQHEIGLYHVGNASSTNRFDELFARIDEALTSDFGPQADAARQIVLRDHTFESRIKQVLALLSLSN